MKLKIDVAEGINTIPAKDIPPGRIAKVSDKLYLIRTTYEDSDELIRVWPSEFEFESISLDIAHWDVTLLPIGTKLTFEF
jgi:hypothetical protein